MTDIKPTEFELACLVKAQANLRNNPDYVEMLKRKTELIDTINNTPYRDNDLMKELNEIIYQMGWYDGASYYMAVFGMTDDAKISPEALLRARMTKATGKKKQQND